MNKKLVIAIVTVFILICGFLGASWLYKKEQKKKMSFLSKESAAVFIPKHAMRKGPDDADVFIVEFMDPECESCRQFSPLLKSVMNEFDGKVQLVVRYAPFHGDSIFAIKLLEASRLQDKYWEALDIMFEYLPIWGSHHDPKPDILWSFLPKAGIDIELVKKDMNRPEIQAIIAQDQKDGEVLQIQGTPTFFVNGKPLEEFSYEALREMIRNELPK